MQCEVSAGGERVTLHFCVHGIAQPKGSTKAFLPKGWTRPIVTSDNPKNKGWQQLVAEAASRAIADAPGFALIESAASLRVTFYLPRPKTLPKKVEQCVKKPDLDKLVRSAKDAMSKVVYRDDALIVEIIARKAYAREGETPRADILVSTQLEIR